MFIKVDKLCYPYHDDYVDESKELLEIGKDVEILTENILINADIIEFIDRKHTKGNYIRIVLVDDNSLYGRDSDGDGAIVYSLYDNSDIATTEYKYMSSLLSEVK